MEAFAAAKAAAQRRGVRKTSIEDDRPRSALLRPGPIIAILIILILGGTLAYFITSWTIKIRTPAWTRLPLTSEDCVKKFLADIATGQDGGYTAAYGLVAPSLKDPNNSDEPGQYRQLYHEMYKYLAGEFGEDWGRGVALTPDPGNPDNYIAHIGDETLHVNTSQQTPAEKLASAGQHFAITEIEEFPISQAAGFQQNEALMAVIGGYAGKGATNNLNTILGASPMNPRLTPMQRKVKLLPILRNPRTTVRLTIIQTWPIRSDPVVRTRLTNISTDERYPLEIQRTAKDVLDEKITEEERIAAGVE
jgi:hypothetical protein